MGFSIQIGRRWRFDAVTLQRLEASASGGGLPDTGLIRDAFEVRLAGRNLAGDAAEDRPALLLDRLVRQLEEQLAGQRRLVRVRFFDSPWELVLGRRDDTALLSVHGVGLRGGVTARNAPVPIDQLLEALQQAATLLERDLAELGYGTPPAPEAPDAGGRWSGRLARLRELAPAGPARTAGQGRPRAAPASPTVRLRVGDETQGLGLELDAADADLLAYEDRDGDDLHALLVPGRFFVRVGEQELAGGGPGRPFLALSRLAEGLVRLLEGQLLGEATSTVPAFDDGATGFALSLSGGARLTLALTDAASGLPLAPRTSFAPETFSGWLIELGSALAERLSGLNPHLARNDRLTDLEQDLEDCARLGRELTMDRAAAELGSTAPAGVALGQVTSLPLTSLVSQPPVAGQLRRLRYSLRWEVPWSSARPPDRLAIVGARLLAAGPDRLAVFDRASGKLRLDRREETGPSWALAGQRLLLLDPAGGRLQVFDLQREDPHPLVRLELPAATRLSPHGALLLGQPEASSTLVVHLQGAGLLAFALPAGTLRWQAAGGEAGEAALTQGGPLVLVSEAGQRLRAHSLADGRPVWRQRLDFRPVGRPLLVGERLVVRGGERRHGAAARLLVLDAATGAPLWQATVGEGEPRPVATDGHRLYVCASQGQGGRISVFDLPSGELRWRQSLDGLGFDAPGAPLLVGQQLFVRTDHGLVGAWRAADGQPLWSRDVGGAAAIHLMRTLDLHYRRGLLFVPTDRLHVLDATDGRPLGQAGDARRIPEQAEIDEELGAYLLDEEAVSAWKLQSIFGVLDS